MSTRITILATRTPDIKDRAVRGGRAPLPTLGFTNYRQCSPGPMAKSDSFFIRAAVTSNGTTYAQDEIDLGSFVNLGVKSSTVLRIHSVTAMIADSNGAQNPILHSADARTAWQLTTQSQTGLVFADDKSMISSGGLTFKTGVTPGHDYDVNPHMYTKGYLVAVDSLFLGVDNSTGFDSGEVVISVILECTLENATQASSTALALSQQ